MYFKTAWILLAAWLVGLTGAYDIGDMMHLLLLVGLMMLLLGFLRAREEALHRAAATPQEKR